MGGECQTKWVRVRLGRLGHALGQGQTVSNVKLIRSRSDWVCLGVRLCTLSVASLCTGAGSDCHA